MRHTLRGGNKEADQLANDAMDKGMGRQLGVGPTSDLEPVSSRPVPGKRPAPPSPPKQVIEGYVKNGVVHLLEGDLPDGTFVNVIPK